MSIEFACACGKQLKLKDELAGKRIKCPACATSLEVPSAGKSAGAAAKTPAPAGSAASKPAAPGAAPRSAPPARATGGQPGAPAKPSPSAKGAPAKPGASVKPAAKSAPPAPPKDTTTPIKRMPVDDIQEMELAEVPDQSRLAKEAAEVKAKGSATCPACGAAVRGGVVICVGCGYDFRTKKRPGDSKGKSEARGGMSSETKLLVFGLIGAIAAAGAVVAAVIFLS